MTAAFILLSAFDEGAETSSGQLVTYESPHHRRVLQRFFQRRGAQGVPLLQEVNVQHSCKRIRLTAAEACNRIVRLDQRRQSLPAYYLVHLVEEQLVKRLLALPQAFTIRMSAAGWPSGRHYRWIWCRFVRIFLSGNATFLIDAFSMREQDGRAEAERRQPGLAS